MKRYKTILKTRTLNGKRLYQTTKYPVLPLNLNDLYVITQESDRFDNLALQYYGDPTLWWAISIANPNLPQNSYFPPPGVQLRIPSNIAGVISNFEQINE
jgi:phage tail protein X